MSRKVLMVLVMLHALSHAMAQTKLPVYDLHTIRQNKSGDYSISSHSAGDAYEATNTTVLDLLLGTYQLTRPELISGLPKWAVTEHFDIRAKISDYQPTTMKDLTTDQRLEMQRRLIADLFKLTVHHENKLGPVYEMRVGDNGLKMVKDDTDPTSDLGKRKRIGRTEMNGSMLKMAGCTTADLVRILSFVLGRDVIDKTGITGRYDVEMHWAPLEEDTESDVTYPSIFTALREQLGLKLIAAKAPVETLVVDQIELPGEN